MDPVYILLSVQGKFNFIRRDVPQTQYVCSLSLKCHKTIVQISYRNAEENTRGDYKITKNLILLKNGQARIGGQSAVYNE